MWRSIKLFLFILFCTFSLSALAQSKSPDDLRKLYEKAEADYKAGDYAAALPGYEFLYKETGQINMVFNIAQCQRELNQYDAAIASYKKFLQEQPANPLRSEIEKTITELEQKSAQQKTKTDEGTAKKKRWFIASGGLLATSAATGVGAFLISQSAKDGGNQPASLRTKGLLLATASDACLVGVGVTLYLGLRRPKTEATLLLTPTEGGATVALSLH